MRSLEQYVSALQGAILPETMDGKTVRMDINEVGSIHIEGTTVTIEELPADCVLTASHEDYDKLFSGNLDPAIAFGTGALAMDGEMSVALKLPSLFAKARG